jgi:hypothetical protein
VTPRPGRWAFLCRLFGHRPGNFQPYGGWPNPVFGVASTCRRCGADTSVEAPTITLITHGSLW